MPHPRYGKWTDNDSLSGASCETLVLSTSTPPPPRHPRDIPDDNPSARVVAPKKEQISLGTPPKAFIEYWGADSGGNHRLPAMCG